MTGFTEQDGVLHADDIPLPELAARFGTPAYIYSAGGIRASVQALQTAFVDVLPKQSQPLIAFACKANSNVAILRLLSSLGLGADVVSGGELQRALKAGIPPQRIVYSGVGKSGGEIRAALEAGIYQINVESAPELERIGAIAQGMGGRAPVALRFNPDVEAGTHAKITTGKEENKFGLLRDEVERLYRYAASHPGLKPVGLSLHIGSQLTDLEPFRLAFEKLAGLAHALKQNGLPVERLDLGGGLGIVYHEEKAPSLHGYAELVRDIIYPLGTTLTLEPGRLLVGPSGLLLTKVEFVKDAPNRRYVILDAGMNDLIRPALYEAWHPIRTVVNTGGPYAPCDIVGPVCETGDTFAVERPLPNVAEGDLIAIMAAGAYGFTMASTYNTRPLPPEILVDGAGAGLIRRRQTVEDLLEAEFMPDWFGAS
jgi:diaminopimelate decarboxylase